jgi:hypothetical protein
MDRVNHLARLARHLAAKGTVEHIIEFKYENLEYFNTHKNKLFLRALANNNYKVAHEFIFSGADVNYEDGKPLDILFSNLVSNKKLTLIYMIQRGVDFNLVLRRACKLGSLEMINNILYNINLICVSGEKPLPLNICEIIDDMCKDKQTEILKLFDKYDIFNINKSLL